MANLCFSRFPPVLFVWCFEKYFPCHYSPEKVSARTADLERLKQTKGTINGLDREQGSPYLGRMGSGQYSKRFRYPFGAPFKFFDLSVS